LKVTNWRDFAKITIETNDLDPTYVFLYNAKKANGNDWATRFAMHYLCFYDLGEAVMAARSSTQETFWDYTMANYPIFARGTERRHSRGQLGLSYIANLARRGTPEELWKEMWAPTYNQLIQKFKENYQNCGFGPYFVWKVMDFQDRVWGKHIDLTLDAAVRYCPDEPRKCAKIMWPELQFYDVMEIVTDYIKRFPAPPGYDRMCSYAEAETVLCMLKGYFITKTHTIGDDIDSKYKQLARFPELKQYLPPKADWSQYERGALES
jgi:hypothetical protein